MPNCAASATNAPGDTERQLDVLRHVHQQQIFHLLAMDLQGLLPLETLSDHLSALADLILRHVLQLCWAGSAQDTIAGTAVLRDHRLWQTGRARNWATLPTST